MAIIQPTKKPRGKEVTPEQKADNREIARRRVRIEHVNSSVKRCRMPKETLRRWKAEMRDMVMEIGCDLHNFCVRSSYGQCKTVIALACAASAVGKACPPVGGARERAAGIAAHKGLSNFRSASGL